MTRKKGSKNKVKAHIQEIPEKQIEKMPDNNLDIAPEAKLEPIKKDDILLPNKSLFRPDEAANYFGYDSSTIYTWIQHGILKAEKYKGTYRISREAILNCRFKSQFDPLV